jgi:hypothetical protein
MGVNLFSSGYVSLAMIFFMTYEVIQLENKNRKMLFLVIYGSA